MTLKINNSLIPNNAKQNCLLIVLLVLGLQEKQGGSRPILTHFSKSQLFCLWQRRKIVILGAIDVPGLKT